MMVGKKLGAKPRPRVTVPKPPPNDTLASRENRVSPVKRPEVPLALLKKPSKAKLAFMPPPKSSVPAMPNQGVLMPPLTTEVVAAWSPAMRMEPMPASMAPVRVTEDCA